MKVDILGLSEVRWPESCDFWNGNYIVIHTGTAHERPGYTEVALVLNKQLGRRVREYVQYNERIILVNIETKPKNAVIIQYMHLSLIHI